MPSFTITESLLLNLKVEYSFDKGDTACPDTINIESAITLDGEQVDILSAIDKSDMPLLEESAWNDLDKRMEGQDEEREEYVHGRRNE
jgi:hypothetical protein